LHCPCPKNLVEPYTVKAGGVCTKQPSFAEAKEVWDKTPARDEKILMV
jgi:hypothetical protein